MFGFIALKKDSSHRPATIRPRVVETQVVSLGDVPAGITAFGRVTSSQPISLTAEVPGELMAGTVPFQPAQDFSKGDLLVKIDDRQAQLDLKSAKSDLLTSLATVLPEIKSDFPNEYQIWQSYFDECGFEKSLADLPETDNRKIKLFLSRFNVYKLYFTVRDLEIRLSKHFFYAPFDGSIVRAELRLGSTARAGTRLGDIISMEDLEVEVPVSAEDIRWIDFDRAVKFTSSEIGGHWTGKIKRVGSSIDTRTQTVPVYIAIDSEASDRLLNGVFLQAEIPGMTIENAFNVPRSAVYNENNVYTITDGKLAPRSVEIARRETETIIVNGGLESGDTLVVELMQGVATGMPAVSRSAKSEGEGE